MARGKYEADQFIPKLQDEIENLRAELAIRQRLEEMLDQLESSSSHNTPAPNHEATSGTPVDENYINNVLDKREKQRIESNNLKDVQTKLIEIYGPDYQSKLESRREVLGVDKKTLDDLARRSPKAFMALVAPQKSSEAPYTPPNSSLSTPPALGAKPRTREWYNQLKKTNPTAYWSTKVQYQMHQDAIAAANRGEDF